MFFQDAVGNDRFAYVTPGGVIAGDPGQYVQPGSAFEGLAKTAIVGEVLRKLYTYSAQVPVGGLLVFEFPNIDFPTRTLCRTVSTDSHVAIGVGLPDALFADQMIDAEYRITNTGAATITVFLADDVATRTPIRYHADHVAARPTIAVGATAVVTISYRPGLAVLRVNPVAATVNRRAQPTLINSLTQGAAENVTMPNLVAGDMILAFDMRSDVATTPTLRVNFLNLSSSIAFTITSPTNIMTGRMSYKFIAAGEESTPIPFPASNPIARCVLQHWRNVDLTAPFIAAAVVTDSTTTGDIPALALAEPGIVTVGIAGRRWSVAAGAYVLPSYYTDDGQHVTTTDAPFVKTGYTGNRFSTPAETFLAAAASPPPYTGVMIAALRGKAI